MHRCPTLTTDRLTLRPWRDDDVDAYLEIHSAPAVRTALHLPDSFDRHEAWRQMALWSGQWVLRNSGHWAVELTASGQIIGRAGTHRPDRPDWPGLEIGWCFHPRHWGNGYATEAGAAAVDWALAHHDDPVLVSCILPENTGSQAVARRLGFVHREDRVLSFFPTMAHGIWELPRP